jgi:hypothetical protein
MTDDDDRALFSEVLAGIYESRGGKGRFTVIHRSIAASMAGLLLNQGDDPVKHAQALSALDGMLPPKVAAVNDGEPDPRLALLSYDELLLLDCLRNRIEGRKYRDCSGADPTCFVGALGQRRRDDGPDDQGLYRPDELAWLLWRDEHARGQIEFLEGRVSELARANDELANQLQRKPKDGDLEQPALPALAAPAEVVTSRGLPGRHDGQKAKLPAPPADRRREEYEAEMMAATHAAAGGNGGEYGDRDLRVGQSWRRFDHPGDSRS